MTDVLILHAELEPELEFLVELETDLELAVTNDTYTEILVELE